MKCPKCQYLGFETSDRCKNCGYDFSLIEFRSGIDAELRPDVPARNDLTPAAWDRFETHSDNAPHADAVLHEKVPDQSTEEALPLFAMSADDQPLVRLPVTPRRPLAVRRTAENPRLRTVPKAPSSEPVLEFPEEAPATRVAPTPIFLMEPPPAAPPRAMTPVPAAESSSARRRCIAAVIDYSLLFSIDVAIVYFTVRMAGLDIANWRMLPIVPLALFLLVIALAYVGVFTAIGGQTIGKMAARIRVVSEDPVPVGALHAFRRTAAVAVSWLTGGLGFLPALVGDHRALHDRLSRTRVVDLESA